MTNIVKSKNISLGGNLPLALIAGPCVIENEDMVLKTAESLKTICQKLDIPYFFKCSYDKANRTSVTSFRGPGLDEGLKILSKVKSELDLEVVSDCHNVSEIKAAGDVLDVIQIPAFLCRQTDLLVAAGETQKIVNVKKGQFVAPWDMENVIDKIKSTGNDKIALTERGSSFGYNNLIVDMTGLASMRSLGQPVIFDATHSAQLPGGQGSSSGGRRDMIPILARAAVGAGVDGLFMEIHPDPDKALCDAPNQFPLEQAESLLSKLKDIDGVVKS